MQLKLFEKQIEITEGRKNYFYLQNFCTKAASDVYDSFIDRLANEEEEDTSFRSHTLSCAKLGLKKFAEEMVNMYLQNDIFDISCDDVIDKIISSSIFDKEFNIMLEMERKLESSFKSIQNQYRNAISIGDDYGERRCKQELGKIEKELNEFIYKEETYEKVGEALQLSASNYFVTLGNGIANNGYVIDWVYEDQSIKAHKLYSNITNPVITDEQKKKIILDIIDLDPTMHEIYGYIFDNYGVAEKRFVCDYIKALEMDYDITPHVDKWVKSIVDISNLSESSDISEISDAINKAKNAMEEIGVTSCSVLNEILDLKEKYYISSFFEKLEKAKTISDLNNIMTDITNSDLSDTAKNAFVQFYVNKSADLRTYKGIVFDSQEERNRNELKYNEFIEQINTTNDCKVLNNTIQQIYNEHLHKEISDPLIDLCKDKEVGLRTFKGIVFSTQDEADHNQSFFNDISKKIQEASEVKSLIELESSVKSEEIDDTLSTELIDSIVNKRIDIEKEALKKVLPNNLFMTSLDTLIEIENTVLDMHLYPSLEKATLEVISDAKEYVRIKNDITIFRLNHSTLEFLILQYNYYNNCYFSNESSNKAIKDRILEYLAQDLRNSLIEEIAVPCSKEINSLYPDINEAVGSTSSAHHYLSDKKILENYSEIVFNDEVPFFSFNSDGKKLIITTASVYQVDSDKTKRFELLNGVSVTEKCGFMGGDVIITSGSDSVSFYYFTKGGVQNISTILKKVINKATIYAQKFYDKSKSYAAYEIILNSIRKAEGKMDDLFVLADLYEQYSKSNNIDPDSLNILKQEKKDVFKSFSKQLKECSEDELLSIEKHCSDHNVNNCLQDLLALIAKAQNPYNNDLPQAAEDEEIISTEQNFEVDISAEDCYDEEVSEIGFGVSSTCDPLNDLISKILDDVNPNSEQSMLEAKSKLQALNSPAANQAINEISIMIHDYYVRINRVSSVTNNPNSGVSAPNTNTNPQHIKCPKCGSANLETTKKGISIGQAAVGALVLGPAGLLAGGIGMNKKMMLCKNCGHKFKV